MMRYMLFGFAALSCLWLWAVPAPVRGEAPVQGEAPRPDAVLSRRPVPLPFAWVREAAVSEARVFGFPARTLTIAFTRGQTVLSTLHGWKEGVLQVGNHYAPPSSWETTHALGLEAADRRVAALYADRGQPPLLLYTGADMANLAYAEAASDGLLVGVLATAGVRGNALRAGTDRGDYVEPGTINLIVLTNRRLSPAAMAGGVITVTEAKTAALQELDIRSSHSGSAATGTGTDNVLLVSGEGADAALAGGHTRLGELLARATVRAVREAVARQNGLTVPRPVLRRLEERRALLTGDAVHGETACRARRVAALLREPRYAGFMEAALALADGVDYGLIQNLDAFADWCLRVAGEAAGGPVTALPEIFTDDALSPPLRMALNALAAGDCRSSP